MKLRKFRKLHINLPRQPVVNQRPWFIAGLLLAVIFLLIAAWMYYSHKKSDVVREGQGKIVLQAEQSYPYFAINN
jgi:cbb3-type cytochrome oxidase subunit 3